MPQFMPGSVNRYAVDFDGDGRIDLQRQRGRRDRQRRPLPGRVRLAARPADALRGGAAGGHRPTARRCWCPTSCRASAPRSSPSAAPSSTPTAAAHDGPLALVELQNGDAAPSYVAGTQNFYAITRYNWSSYYAMAVIKLGEAVKRQR